MNKKEVITVISVVGILLGCFIYAMKRSLDQEEENKKLSRDNQKLQENNIKLLINSAKNEKEYNALVVEQIENVIALFKEKNIDNDVVVELQEALELYKLEKTSDTLIPIVRILEHLLEIRYDDNEECKTWLRKNGRKKTFKSLLDYCYFEKGIDEKEYVFIDKVRELRNRKIHDVAFYRTPEELDEAIVIGVSSISKFMVLAYPQILGHQSVPV